MGGSIFRLSVIVPCLATLVAGGSNLVRNPDFLQRTNGRTTEYELIGDADYCYLGDPTNEVSSWGVALYSAGKVGSGTVAQTVKNIDAKAGRWFRFTFRGLPQKNFAVAKDGLWMKVEFLADGGATAAPTGMDGKIKRIDSLVEQARQQLSVNGDGRINGAVVWQTYQLDFYIPFLEVNQLRLTVGYDHGTAHQANRASFFVTDFSLTQITALADQGPTTFRADRAPMSRPAR